MLQIDSIHSHLSNRNEIAEIALSPNDAFQLEKDGKRAIFIGIENGYPVGQNINNIQVFYDKGARYIPFVTPKTMTFVIHLQIQPNITA